MGDGQCGDWSRGREEALMAAHLLLEGVDLSAAPPKSYIVEIGSVREPSPLPSSLYLERKALECNLEFLTVDFSEGSWQLAQQYVGTHAILSDGQRFLQQFQGAIAVLYLDNFDYPYTEAKAKELFDRCGVVYTQRGETITQTRSVEVHF